MPARRDTPLPLPANERLPPKWDEAFKRDFVRLRPHLENRQRPLLAHVVGALTAPATGRVSGPGTWTAKAPAVPMKRRRA